MQQVQAGKINLDTDVNNYLDFKIPPLRRQADHAAQPDDPHAGFRRDRQISDQVRRPSPIRSARCCRARIPDRDLPAGNDAGLFELRRVARRLHRPARLGRAVQRAISSTTSSLRWAWRIRRFEQPLPPNLAPLVSKAYQYPSDKPEPYEVIPMAPAGALASTGADMGKFMIAQLANGGPLLNPADGAADARAPVECLLGAAGHGARLLPRGSQRPEHHRSRRRHDLHALRPSPVPRQECRAVRLDEQRRQECRGASASRAIVRGFHRPLFPGAAAEPADREHGQGAWRGAVGPLCQQPRGSVQLHCACWPCSARPRCRSTRTAS